MPQENLVQTDVLVIGGGISGCFAAIEVKKHGLDVVIVDKSSAGKSGASAAADRATMVFNPGWGLDFAACMHEFTTRGEYINNCDWDEVVLKESLAVYQDLVAWGARFPADALEHVKEWPPFGNMRIIHRENPRVLRRQAEKVGVKIIDRVMITDLLQHEGEISGAIGFSCDSGDLCIFKAKATVLCGGGSGHRPLAYAMWPITGDGEGMAYRAGAEITGKEFCDTHYTWADYPAWDVHRSADAAFPYFIDAAGERVGIGSSLGWETNLSMEFIIHAGRGPVFWNLDAATDEDIERMKKRQAAVHSPLQYERIGADLSRRGKIKCVGGANAGYSPPQTGGVWITSTRGTTDLRRLFAAGDCGGTRINGSYYSNPGLGTCPAAVTGKKAGSGAAEFAAQASKPLTDSAELARLKSIVYTPIERKSGFNPRWVTQLLQNTIMPYFISFIKHGDRLQAALTTVEFLTDHLVPKLVARDAHELRLAHETKNMVLNAEMVLRSSLFRTESRGVHYREDYPHRDDPAWLAWTKVKEENGNMRVFKEPIPREWWPDLSLPYKQRYPMRFPGEKASI